MNRKATTIVSGYSRLFYATNGALAAMGAAMGFLAYFVMRKPEASQNNYWFAALWCCLIAASLFFFSVGALLRHRPIGMGDNGVASYAFGLKLKQIPWATVKKVESLRYTDPLDPTHRKFRFKYRITGTDTQIWFDDGLVMLPDILRIMNEYIQRYHIEILSVDHGLNVKRR